MYGLIIEPHYLPCIEYFVMLNAVKDVTIECYEHYQKQSYRNRCRIMTAHGPLELYVPVSKPSGGNVLMKDVRVDYRQKWVKDHWRTIKTAYGNAPFFEHFGFYFQEIYQKKPDFLLDLDLEFIDLCKRLLNLSTPIRRTTKYHGAPPANQLDWRCGIHPKKHLKSNPFYKPCNYNQIFGKNFVGNLSIIDLLFCEGPSSGQILERSKP